MRYLGALAPLPVALLLAACQGPIDGGGLAVERQAVVNGRPANAGDLHATVALVTADGFFFCTGTLVRPELVISAAHCFQDPETMRWMTAQEVFIASNSLSALPAPAGQRHAVTRYVRHPSYPRNEFPDGTGMGRDDDLAVVMLAQPIRDQNPVPILPAERLGELEPRRTAIIVSGYGITDVTGQNDRSGQLHVGETPYLDRSEHEFLAGGNGLTDTCNGDSGGPAYVVLDGTRYLLGATSRAAHDSQGDCGDRGLYTLVPGYLDWLAGETDGALGGGAPPMEPEPIPMEPEPTPQEPEPVPQEPEPLPPEPEPVPIEPEPVPQEPEPVPIEPEPPVTPPAPESMQPVCDTIGDGFCAIDCVRVDPDCQAFALPDTPVAPAAARFTGGCTAQPGPMGAWWVMALLLGWRRRA